MEIIKYKGTTEDDARQLVKEELGVDALIVSVKKIKPKGIFRIFRKAYVEITAARDDRTISKGLPSIQLDASALVKNKELMEDSHHSEESELNEFKSFIARYSSKQKDKQKVVNETVKSIEASIGDEASEVVDFTGVLSETEETIKLINTD